jgi:hypothetical protein
VIKQSKIIIMCIILAFALSNNVTKAQILKDTAAFNLIEKCADYIYGFHFRYAEETCKMIGSLYPEHPVIPLLKGMIKYWENYPLIPSSPVRASYENDLQSCIRLCEKNHSGDDEAEYLLMNLCARGMLLMFYSDNDFSSEVFPLASGSYSYIRRSFDHASVYPDFNFFTGLYDYYREAYPEAHPIYKPLALLFPKGDLARGLKELRMAGQNSIVLKAESYSFLSWICINFENDFQQATKYSKTLHELYPANIQYLSNYIKNLLLLKQYDEVEILMRSSVTENKNPFFQAQLTIFNGILQEKKYNNGDLAFKLYEKGVADISPYSSFGNEYSAYAYFGLSRISDKRGDKTSRKIYKKMALELAEFKKVDFDE